MTKIIIEVQVLTDSRVAEIHCRNLEMMVRNYLQNQAYERYEYVVQGKVEEKN